MNVRCTLVVPTVQIINLFNISIIFVGTVTPGVNYLMSYSNGRKCLILILFGLIVFSVANNSHRK